MKCQSELTLKYLGLWALFASLLLSLPAFSQSEQSQFDVGFGVGTVVAPSASSASGRYAPQTIGGGAYLSFSGDYIFWHHLGVEGEVAWRASENLYGGNQPFRPIFYDFNAIYAPPLGHHAQLELLGGLGGLSTRFYTQTYTCDFFTYSCTNYVSSNHFMGDVGAGIRVYLTHGVFVRPEFREYFIHNNVEFSSGHATRASGTLGYSFGH
jgi:Outer membrane protein beta-barrel domain